MHALLFLGMLGALIAGCFWFVCTLPTYEVSAPPEFRRRPLPQHEQHQGEHKCHSDKVA